MVNLETSGWRNGPPLCTSPRVAAPGSRYRGLARRHPLINALDHLYVEWNYKPLEAVTLPFIGKALENGRFPGDETVDKSAVTMLDELLRWTKALSVLRTPMSR